MSCIIVNITSNKSGYNYVFDSVSVSQTRMLLGTVTLVEGQDQSISPTLSATGQKKGCLTAEVVPLVSISAITTRMLESFVKVH